MRYDCVIIGSGVAGYPAAVLLAREGHKVAVIEEKLIGGECTNYGCVPSKSLYMVAEAFRSLKKVGAEIRADWKEITKFVERVVDESRKGIEYLLEKHDVEIIESKGRLASSKQIKTDKGTIEAEKIVLALGTDPKPLPNINFDNDVVSNREIFYVDEKPERLLVVGGGVIGVEVSNIFAQLGTEVILVEAMEHILPFLDKDVAIIMRRYLKDNGVRIKERVVVKNIEKKDGKLVVELPNNEILTVDKALVSIGRIPKTKGIGLENAGIEVDQYGFIKVDKFYRTTNTNIYAVGDVVGGPLLAHKAMLESIAAYRNIVGKEPITLNYSLVPQTIFSGLELSWIGYTEKELRSKKVSYKKIKLPISYLSAVRIKDSKYSYVKLLLSEEKQQILGIHIVAPNASEVISSFIPFIIERIDLKKIAETPYPHLTISEIVREVAEYIIGEPIHTILKHI
ncbi:MAG: dihydrolipoyl dehydrogenase [Staphylothermus sp.]|nr:dihydrolipoyl dehydrogenase [Staphylothermus sp.]